MKTWQIAAVLYIIISLAIYFISDALCRKNPVFKMPESRALYYFLSFTWGLPMVLLGCIVALILTVIGKKSHKYGYGRYFEFENIDWGMELGIFFIVPKNCSPSLKNHEHGHGIQNIYIGIFTPLVVTLPSLLRHRYREFRHKVLKKTNKTSYDSIWFEKSASASGNAFIQRYEKSGNK